MAIESVLSQTFTDLELIVVDNASTDDTEAVVRRYAHQDARVRYFKNPSNLGAYGNFNRCYDHAHPMSPYLAYLPSDDLWAETFLEQTVAIAERHPDVSFIHTSYERIDESGRKLPPEDQPKLENLPRSGIYRDAHKLFRNIYLTYGAMLLNRTQVERLHPERPLFDEGFRYAADYLLLLKLVIRGAYGFYHPETLMLFRRYETSLTTQGGALKCLGEEITIFEKKLRGLCPPELEGYRAEALSHRLAVLGFKLLELGRGDEAHVPLRQAAQLSPARRLDLWVALLTAALPVSPEVRAGLWHAALSASQAAREQGVQGKRAPARG